MHATLLKLLLDDFGHLDQSLFVLLHDVLGQVPVLVVVDARLLRRLPVAQRLTHVRRDLRPILPFDILEVLCLRSDQVSFVLTLGPELSEELFEAFALDKLPSLVLTCLIQLDNLVNLFLTELLIDVPVDTFRAATLLFRRLFVSLPGLVAARVN